MKKILVSACLLGEPCRYDGASKPSNEVLSLAEDAILMDSTNMTIDEEVEAVLKIVEEKL